MRVLLVEDDDGVATALIEELGARGHQPCRVSRGSDALIRHRDADLVLLDLGLPDCDGLDVLRKLRRVADIPVLVLTARGDERSVVRGLHLGADDYLVKPVRLPVLLARMAAVTRRTQRRAESGDDVVTLDDLVINMHARTVSVAGEPIGLTPKEFDVLAVLARASGTAVSRQVLMDEVWGDAYAAVSRSLDVHIVGLRAKLGRPGLIVTIRAFGYRLGT